MVNGRRVSRKKGEGKRTRKHTGSNVFNLNLCKGRGGHDGEGGNGGGELHSEIGSWFGLEKKSEVIVVN